MYFKNDFHESLFNKIIKKLNISGTNREYEAFALVAAATEKEGLINAFSDYDIDVGTIWELSSKWSESERYLLEIAWQLFNGSNLYINPLQNDEPLYTSWGNMLGYLDRENKTVILAAVEYRFF